MTREELEKLIRGWDPKDELEDKDVIIVQKGKNEEGEEMKIREVVFVCINYIPEGVEVSPDMNSLSIAETEIIPIESIVAIYPVRTQEEATQLAVELLNHLVKLTINPSLLQKVFTPREKE